MKKNKLNTMVINVVTVAGNIIPKNKTFQLNGEYYEKWDRNVKTNKYDIVIPLTVDNDGKPSSWRRVVKGGGTFDWCHTTNRYENVLDSTMFVQVFLNGENHWFTKEAASKLPYYYELKDIQRGWEGLEKVYFDGINLPKTVYFSPLLGENIDISKLKLNSSLVAYYYNKTLDKNNSGEYRNDLYQYYRPKYTRFNLGIYGEHDNPAFEVAQESGDIFFKNNSNLFNSKISQYDDLLKDLTVGAEIEAFSGFVNEQLCFDLGIVPVKDGSLEGKSCEYITTVLRDKPLSRLYKIFTELNKSLAVNKSCALQYHIGGVDTSPENVVALYMGFYQLRNEFFNIIAPYRRNLAYIRIKREVKDHCKELPCLDLFDSVITTNAEYNSFVQTAHSDILKFLNEGQEPSKRPNGLYKHCKEGRPKWEWNSRYYMVNFLPFFFESKRTIEFRTHSGTTNPVKAINFLLLLVAMIRYIDRNKQAIIKNKIKLRLVDIIDEIYCDKPELRSYLKAYVKSRKQWHKELYLQGDNNIYGDEFTADTDYNFKLNGQSIYE